MTVTIFIRSYNKDFEWLTYCLRSIHKFAVGFSEIIIAVPEGQEGPLKHLTAETVITVYDGQPGYMSQMVSKMTADAHTQADYILYMDSDTIFTTPVTPQTFMDGTRVRWLMTPWKDCPEVKRIWFHVMCKCLQECPSHEFMRRHPIVIPRWALAAFRDFIKATHGIEMEQYVMNQPGREFSEFDCIGFYLWLYHRDKLSWHDTSTMGVPEPWVNQEWSWAGLTDEIREKLERILA